VACHLILQGQFNDENSNADTPDTLPPGLKKLKIYDPIMDVLNTIIIPVTATTREPATTRTAKDIARQEIEYYRNMEDSERPLNMKDTIHWWHKRTIREAKSWLSQVTTSLLACKPSSGGLECDFGLLNDLIALKQASLGWGMVEIELMLKFNRNIMIMHPNEVKKLPNDAWKEFIPARLMMILIHKYKHSV
jgi:hypothetical protein